MRALFVSLYFGSFGGLELYSLNSVKALIESGVEVDVISVYANTQVDDQLPIAQIAPTNRLLHYAFHRFPHRYTEFFLRVKLLRQKYDVVIAGHVNVLLEVSRIAASRQIPCWLCVYGIDIWNPLPVRIKQALKNVSKVVTISTFTKNFTEALYPYLVGKISIIYAPVDTELFQPSINPKNDRNEFILLTVGRLSSEERYKGHDLVLTALALLKKTCDLPITYWIVGDGDDRPRLERLAGELGISQNVKFYGKIDMGSLVKCYQECDIFVMPSYVSQRANGDWTGEGLGIVYLEAAACEKPVIGARNGGGALDIIRDEETGLLVDCTPENIAEGILRLARDHTLRAQYGKTARAIVTEKFSWPAFVSGWKSLL